jgi:hypothetical protein
VIALRGRAGDEAGGEDAPASDVRPRLAPARRTKRLAEWFAADQKQHEHVFERKREAMASDLLVGCVALVNAWKDRRDLYSDDSPIVADELVLTPAGPPEARSWMVRITRRSLEDLGAGKSDRSPIDAVIRFRICVENELGRANETPPPVRA